ncbi:MAG: S8 family serine peptidase, partial [Firmicutes bacterium]|nr:S8 family serine peptidase [Bacillota bacterium]
MKCKKSVKRLLSLILVVSMLAAWFVFPVGAADKTKVKFTKVDNDSVSAAFPGREQANLTDEESPYKDTDIVRVSIVLNKESTIDAGYSTDKIAANAEAMAYRADLQKQQDAIVSKIESVTKKDLNVVWNLTLAANLISANVEYGQIKTIEKISGVQEVLIETRYEPMAVEKEETNDPNMATSSKQIGSAFAWSSGYTGAGMRIAIIDTGVDSDHQSLDNGAFNYSLAYRAGLAGMTPEEYKEKLDLLDAAEVAAVADKLNVKIDPEQTFVSSKIPFAYNYVDDNYDITHDNDQQGEHGSHVTGIAAANAYIPNGDGTYSNALDTVKVQGVAPDAQIITMKVFGSSGGAYDSDYMVAIEDAIILGCDSVNLSLGSGNPGMSRNSNAKYQAILDSLVSTNTVVCMSAGNSGSWVENAYPLGYLYAEDVSMDTAGSPGSFTNSVSVASVNNDGTTGVSFSVAGNSVVYNETSYKNEPLAALAGEHEYVFIDGSGTEEDWAAVGEDLVGKIAFCSRGSISFYQKADFAAEAGAIATIIYNNQSGVINMDLSDYSHTAPVVSITQADGAMVKANSTAVTNDAGDVLYYTGTITITEGVSSSQFNSDFYTMSDFSSWGVPGSLELKPEITAPGGSIYSIWGSNNDNPTSPKDATDKYETMSGTSMASPQVAGMMALVKQYIEENGLSQDGLTDRALAISLLMSTAVPMGEGENDGYYYPVLRQGAGLANVGAAISADSYILMGADATKSYADGKVKAELGDDPDRTGVYTFSFSINNLTGEDKVYALSADIFTQAPFLYYANANQSLSELAYYMDTVTTPLDANTVFTVDGKTVKAGAELAGRDFNGDGVINEADGQALLDYATGVRTTLYHADKADLNEDGKINSYDAYLFFSLLDTAAVVPANGSVTVTVTITLDENDKAILDEAYANGAYIEGYVYAESVSSEEGVEGTSHSIPVLGFYGNWTDPSMYEVGSYAEYAAGDEYKTPYLGKADANSYLITYADDPKSLYYFGGNPLVPDDTYMPERNAINSENGDSISKLQFAAIRNAAASRFTAVNVTTGETYIDALSGEVASAYYYVNGGAWKNTSYTLNTKFVPADAAEGDILNLALTLAPEYYTDAAGNVDWDALGYGADFGVSMVVDNTAPELKDVSVSLTGNTMTATASDNQYVAAVALYNKAGTVVYTYTGAKQDIQPGEEAEYVLDLDGVNGKRFLLQVFDYAMNATTYVIEMQIGEEQPLPEMMVFDLDENYWTTFTKETTYDQITAYSPTSLTFVSGTIVDHMVLAGTADGDLYVMHEDDLTEETLVGNMGAVVTDMAYNKADGKVYGVSNGNLVTIDKLTGELKVVDEIGVVTNTLACDANGTFYCNKYGSGEVYSFTLDTIAEPELLVATNLRTSQYIQTMEINPNTGMLCWNSYYAVSVLGMTFGYGYYYEIDTATGEYTRYNDLWDEMAALVIPEKTSGGSGWLDPTDKVSGIQISDATLTLLKGSSKTLTATVQPWTAVDRTVTWSTSDPSIATVDAKGVVTGVGAGECIITATSNLDPTVTAECKVTVELLTVTLHGALQDTEGVLQTFDWNMETDDTWTGGQKFTDNIISGTANGKGLAYATDSSGKSVITMDLTTGETTTIGAAPIPLADMAISEFSTDEQDLLEAVYYYYFLPAKDPTNITTSAFGFSDYLSQYTGGSEFVGVTTDGWTVYNGNDAEVVYLLDDAGYIWSLKVYATDTGYSTGISFIPTNLVDIGYEKAYDDSENTLSSLIVGEDGNLYFSAFNGETNVLYRLAFDAESSSFVATVIGNVGEEVWPAVLFEATSNGSADGAAIHALEIASVVTVDSRNISA